MGQLRRCRRIAAKIRVANDATPDLVGSSAVAPRNEAASCRMPRRWRQTRLVAATTRLETVIAVRFGALASHLTDTHIVFVQGRRTQGFAVLSGEVAPTYRCPELA